MSHKHMSEMCYFLKQDIVNKKDITSWSHLMKTIPTIKVKTVVVRVLQDIEVEERFKTVEIVRVKAIIQLQEGLEWSSYFSVGCSSACFQGENFWFLDKAKQLSKGRCKHKEGCHSDHMSRLSPKRGASWTIQKRCYWEGHRISKGCVMGLWNTWCHPKWS